MGIVFSIEAALCSDGNNFFLLKHFYVVMGIVFIPLKHFYVVMGKTIPTRVRTFGIVLSQGMYFWNSFIPGYVFYVVKGMVFLCEFAT